MILVQKTINKKKDTKAFTLIEVLLVIVLIAIISGTLITKISNVFRANAKSSVRRYSSLVRYAYDQAVLTGLLHRIVLDMDKQSWIVEKARPGVLPYDEQLRDFTYKSDDEKQTIKEKFQSNFMPAKGAESNKVPKGVKIVSASSWRLGTDKIATKGTLSVYAYPSGFIDESSITLAEAGRENIIRYVVSTRPLTGRVDIRVETNDKIKK